MCERIKYYQDEISRIFAILEKEDPKGEHYGKLLAKIKAYEDLIASLEKQKVDETYRAKEFDFKTEKANFEQQQAKARFEKEREDADEQRRMNEKRLENDLKRDAIKAGDDILTTLLRGAVALGGSYIAGQVTMAIAKGIFSEETSGNLVNSKLMGIISKPNLFNLKF